jgi:hypothetical protein
MAKIVTSAIVADIRKKIGGNVFSKVRSGAIVRRKVSPIQPRTNTQRNVRANFAAISKRWGSAAVGDTNRAGWNALAQNYPQKDKFGASHTLTGLQMYQKLNRNLQTISHGYLDIPPATLAAPNPGAITIVATSPATLTANPDNAIVGTEVAAVSAAAQQSAGRTFVGNRYRLLTTFVFASTTPWDIASVYTAKFGSLISGKKVSVLVKYIDPTTGAAGIAGSGQKTVT